MTAGSAATPARAEPSDAAAGNGMARADRIMPARRRFGLDRTIREGVAVWALQWIVIFPS
jgi:hypothetical protein